jgi:hypothetical protein
MPPYHLLPFPQLFTTPTASWTYHTQPHPIDSQFDDRQGWTY